MLVGVIGLGVMGAEMAGNVSRSGFVTMGFDADASKRVSPIANVDVTDTFARVGECAEILLLSLPGPDTCRKVVGEALSLDAVGQIIVDTSTVDPDTSEELAQLADAHGRQYIAAPVLGGQARARNAALTVIAGGGEAALKAATPVLAAIGKTVHVVGDVRTATTLKLLNNLLSLGNTVVFSEALALAAGTGVQASLVYDVLQDDSGTSAAFKRRWKDNIEKGDYRAGFTVELAAKDLRLVCEFAKRHGLGLPVAEETLASFDRLRRDGLGDADVSSVVRWWEGRLGLRIGGEPPPGVVPKRQYEQKGES